MSIYHCRGFASVEDAGTQRDMNILWFCDRAITRVYHLLKQLHVWHEVVIYVRLLACRVGPTEVHHVSSCSELQMILKQVGDDFATPFWQEWSPLPRVRRGVAKSPGRRHGCDFCLETR